MTLEDQQPAALRSQLTMQAGVGKIKKTNQSVLQLQISKLLISQESCSFFTIYKQKEKQIEIEIEIEND